MRSFRSAFGEYRARPGRSVHARCPDRVRCGTSTTGAKGEAAAIEAREPAGANRGMLVAVLSCSVPSGAGSGSSRRFRALLPSSGSLGGAVAQCTQRRMSGARIGRAGRLRARAPNCRSTVLFIIGRGRFDARRRTAVPMLHTDPGGKSRRYCARPHLPSAPAAGANRTAPRVLRARRLRLRRLTRARPCSRTQKAARTGRPRALRSVPRNERTTAAPTADVLRTGRGVAGGLLPG